MFKAWIFKLIHTQHEYKPINYSVVIQKTYTMNDLDMNVKCVGYIHNMELYIEIMNYS